jgi:hypothetical protein
MIEFKKQILYFYILVKVHFLVAISETLFVAVSGSSLGETEKLRRQN